MAAYALANELLRREVDAYANRAPGARWLTAEWSVWDGAGLAARMGAVAAARSMGIVPIPLAHGLKAVERLLGWPGEASALWVGKGLPQPTGRAPS
jgi:hypothetical protein